MNPIEHSWRMSSLRTMKNQVAFQVEFDSPPFLKTQSTSGEAVRSVRWLYAILQRCPQRVLHDFRNRSFVDSTLLAVTRLHPMGELPCAFAGIARHATSGNILTSDDPCVVDDVFPRCDSSPRAPLRHPLNQLDATIDTSFISLLHFLFEPIRNAPIVHILS